MEYKFGDGRPPKYATVDEMQKKIEEYFETGRGTTEVYSNGMKFTVPVVTITGLCLYLGFASRQSFYDYEKKDEGESPFSYTIKRARTFIEHEYEKQLQRGNTSGAIFALKNFGWKDIQTLEGELNDNGNGKFVIEHKHSKYENLDKDGNEIKDDEK